MEMIMSREGMETMVWILPYEKTSIDSTMFVQKTGEPMLIRSVPGYEETLVKIALPDGSCVVVKADQIITAIRKCVL